MTTKTDSEQGATIAAFLSVAALVLARFLAGVTVGALLVLCAKYPTLNDAIPDDWKNPAYVTTLMSALLWLVWRTLANWRKKKTLARAETIIAASPPNPPVSRAAAMRDSPTMRVSKFLDPFLYMACHERPLTWRVEARCRWYSGRMDRVFSIPRNLILDLYSVPRPFWMVYPPAEGREDAAAALHDFLVRYRKRLGIGLRDCHREFLHAMHYLGAGRVERFVKWGNVWCFNWLAAGPGDGTAPISIREIQAKYPILEPPGEALSPEDMTE